MPRFLRSLFGQVVLALVVGVLLGLLAPDFAAKLKPLGDGFIKRSEERRVGKECRL